MLGQPVADTFSLDDATASFELLYVSTNVGWVVIGAN